MALHHEQVTILDPGAVLGLGTSVTPDAERATDLLAHDS